MKQRFRLAVLVVACLCMAGVASAGTVVSRPGDTLNTPATFGDDLGLMLAVSWTQQFFLSDWTIHANNLQLPEEASSAEVRFELLRGGLTGVGVSMGSFTQTLTDTDPHQYIVLQHTNSQVQAILQPGTYYLVASSTTSANWFGGDGTWTTDPEFAGRVAMGSDFVNDGGVWMDLGEPGYGLGFQVDGLEATAPVPEPASFAMIGGGLLLIGAFLRRRRRA